MFNRKINQLLRSIIDLLIITRQDFTISAKTQINSYENYSAAANIGKSNEHNLKSKNNLKYINFNVIVNDRNYRQEML